MSEVKQHAGLFPAVYFKSLLQMLGKQGIVLHPPERGLRHEQKARTSRAERFEMVDSLVVLRGVLPGVSAVGIAREMPRLGMVREQAPVSLVDH